MAPEIGEREPLARFLVHGSDFKAASGRPTYNAFMPSPSGETSVYRVEGLGHGDIRTIGAAHVEPYRGPLKGHAIQVVQAVVALGLVVESKPTPHPAHANIKGWSLSRPRDRIVAEKIAATANLMLY